MRHAKAARTLASGQTGATVQVAWNPGTFRVRHAINQDGNPLLLCRSGGALDSALRGGDVAAVVSVRGIDGRVWISGWATRLTFLAARAAALEFASVNPLSDLLDVGRGFALYRVDVAEVRVDYGTCMVEVAIDDYVSVPVT